MDLRGRARSLVIAGLLAAGCGSGESAPSALVDASACTPASSPLLCGRRMNIAHRGGGLLAPEETLVAFQNADELGVDVLELDVRATLDGVIVCMHDAAVDRTTDGSGRIDQMTLDELRALDAGHRFSPDDGATFPFRGQGVVVPTLDEVLAALPGRLFSIELKQAQPSIVAAVLATVDAHEARERVVLASFFDDTLFEIRAQSVDVLTSLGLGEMLAFNALTDETEPDYVPPARIIQAPFASVTPEVMARAERLGLAVQAWTVNDPAEMSRLLDLNVHGIMSDDPALLAQAIKEP
jgi:glycerophosphoryl diester phosphodiesterase